MRIMLQNIVVDRNVNYNQYIYHLNCNRINGCNYISIYYARIALFIVYGWLRERGFSYVYICL